MGQLKNWLIEFTEAFKEVNHREPTQDEIHRAFSYYMGEAHEEVSGDCSSCRSRSVCSDSDE